MNKIKKDTRVILYFQWATGESDYINLPCGLLKDVVKIVEKYDQYFVPVVQVGKGKFYFCSNKGTLRPLT